jgi:S1-C subfamily serine protease
MRYKVVFAWLLALFVLTLSTAWVSTTYAAKIVLHDGTVLEGTVIPTADGYWVKLADGSTKIVSKDDVQSYSDDSNPQASTGSGTDIATDDASQAFRLARSQAEGAESAMAGVAVWQNYVDKYPDSSEIDQAKAELERWKKLATDGAEKINGVWVGGDDRKKIIAQADDLTRQAVDMLENKQTLQAVDKLKQAVKIYPNSFLTNFSLGFISINEGNYDDAATYFSTSSRLRPQSAEAQNNLAVANISRHRFEVAIDEFLNAAKIQDSKEVAENLVTAIAFAPPDLRNLPKMKPTLEAASLLQSQYNISGPASDGRFWILPPPIPRAKPGHDPGPGAGQQPPDQPGPDSGQIGGWSGTGFFISADGLILTNRHVAKGAKLLHVQFDNGQTAAVEVVAIDDKYDLAVVRLVDRSKKIPYVHLSPEDSPAEGADCTVMGFPMIDQLGADLKITRGVVSSSAQDQGNGADVLTDAKVNPGNSGGPIVDKFGNVMAIVCMKSITEGEFDSYGIGISAGHVREFLQRHNINIEPGSETGPQLDTEAEVKHVKPATVCIYATN